MIWEEGLVYALMLLSQRKTREPAASEEPCLSEPGENVQPSSSLKGLRKLTLVPQ